MLAMAASDLLIFKKLLPLRLFMDILSGCVLLLAYPLGHEDPSASSWFSWLAAAVLAAGFLGVRCAHVPEVIYLLMLPLVMESYIQFRNYSKYSDVRRLFRPDTVWCTVEESARDSYSLAVPVLATFAMAGVLLGAGIICYLPLIAAGTVLYILLHYRAYSGKTMFLRESKERKIRELTSAGLRSVPLSEIQDTQLVSVFDRIQKLFEQKKPYLDEDFSLEELSKLLCVNKTYVSRAINAMSGKNFRQFINYQRVLYSMEMMKKNPKYKVIELAFMSGFHSVVTYNVCFKMFLNANPSDYLSRYRLSGQI